MELNDNDDNGVSTDDASMETTKRKLDFSGMIMHAHVFECARMNLNE